MFKPKTLFVLGAGASCEFALPSGEALKGLIGNRLNITFPDGYRQDGGDRIIVEALRAHCAETGEHDINPYLHSSWQIRDAMPQCLSIDNFLDAHQSNEKIKLCGKLGISQSIISAEKSSSLMSDRPDGKVAANTYSGTWLNPFAQRLTEGLKKEDVKSALQNLSFIVFNYDRCLETALFNILQNYYFISSSEAADIVSGAEIYHPYGSLGRLPWQLQSSSDMTVGFGESLTGKKLKQISTRIKTFTERLEDDLVLKQIRNVVAEASKIIFLGFGFLDLNMQLLASNNQNVYEIYCTALGSSESDVNVASRLLATSLRQPTLPTPCFANITACELLKQYGRAICA